MEKSGGTNHFLRKILNTGAVICFGFSQRMMAYLTRINNRDLKTALIQALESGVLRFHRDSRCYCFNDPEAVFSNYHELSPESRRIIHAETAKYLRKNPSSRCSISAKIIVRYHEIVSGQPSGPSEMIELVRKLIYSGFDVPAKILLDGLKQSNSGNPEDYYLLSGQIAFLQGDRDRAEQFFKQLSSVNEPDRTTDGEGLLSRVLVQFMRDRDLGGVESIIRRYRGIPGDSRYLSLLEWLVGFYHETGRLSDACKAAGLLRAARDHGKAQIRSEMIRARLHSIQDDLHAARNDLARALAQARAARDLHLSGMVLLLAAGIDWDHNNTLRALKSINLAMRIIGPLKRPFLLRRLTETRIRILICLGLYSSAEFELQRCRSGSITLDCDFLLDLELRLKTRRPDGMALLIQKIESQIKRFSLQEVRILCHLSFELGRILLPEALSIVSAVETLLIQTKTLGHYLPVIIRKRLEWIENRSFSMPAEDWIQDAMRDRDTLIWAHLQLHLREVQDENTVMPKIWKSVFQDFPACHRFPELMCDLYFSQGIGLIVDQDHGTRVETGVALLIQSRELARRLNDAARLFRAQNSLGAMIDWKTQDFTGMKFPCDPCHRKRPPAAAMSGIVGDSPPVRKLQHLISAAAANDAAVHISGETGSGKELVARAIHERSLRNQGPFVAYNCATGTDNLIESDLFGHIRGAFTNAAQSRRGLFQTAQGGTLFLDEVADIPWITQARMLRVLQEKTIRPVGSDLDCRVDVRIISATNRNLLEEVSAGRFRLDLYYRLIVIEIPVPPLRDRKEDLVLLLQHFTHRLSGVYGGLHLRFTDSAMRLLETYSWPGNIRELQNLVEVCVHLSKDRLIGVSEIRDYLKMKHPEPPEPLAEALAGFEKDYISQALAFFNGNVSKTATAMKISRQGLFKKMKRYSILSPMMRQSQKENH